MIATVWPGFEAAAPQFVRDGGDSLVKLAESDRARLIVVFFVEKNVRATRLGAAAQAEYFGERFGSADLLFEVGRSYMAMSYITRDRLRGDGCGGAGSARGVGADSLKYPRAGSRRSDPALCRLQPPLDPAAARHKCCRAAA